MPGIFISYRREDASGAAGHLASDLRKRFGSSRVFIDIDTIAPGADFEDRIERALGASRVTLVLIGDRWLTAALPDGTRRLDDASDYVRKEIATALGGNVAVVPVLVEGAQMPKAAQLPGDIAALATRNAMELSNKRWRYDLGQLCAVARRYDRWWVRILHGRPRMLASAATAVLAAAAVILASGVASGGGAQNRAILVPATVAPAVDECTSQLTSAVDGTVGPLECSHGKLNALAWQYYAKFNPTVMALGRFATEGQVFNAFCADARNTRITTPIESAAYQLALRYYGWRFVVPPDPTTTRC